MKLQRDIVHRGAGRHSNRQWKQRTGRSPFPSPHTKQRAAVGGVECYKPLNPTPLWHISSCLQGSISQRFHHPHKWCQILEAYEGHYSFKPAALSLYLDSIFHPLSCKLGRRTQWGLHWAHRIHERRCMENPNTDNDVWMWNVSYRLNGSQWVVQWGWLWNLQEAEPCCKKYISGPRLGFYSHPTFPVWCFLDVDTMWPATPHSCRSSTFCRALSGTFWDP